MQQTLTVWYMGDRSPVLKRSEKNQPRCNAVSLRAGKPGRYGVTRYLATVPFLYFARISR